MVLWVLGASTSTSPCRQVPWSLAVLSALLRSRMRPQIMPKAQVQSARHPRDHREWTPGPASETTVRVCAGGRRAPAQVGRLTFHWTDVALGDFTCPGPGGPLLAPGSPRYSPACRLQGQARTRSRGARRAEQRPPGLSPRLAGHGARKASAQPGSARPPAPRPGFRARPPVPRRSRAGSAEPPRHPARPPLT